jgi:hypothetical protein
MWRVTAPPDIAYARSRDVAIAYEAVGNGPRAYRSGYTTRAFDAVPVGALV